jgi:O-antigen/teichoic acid export membrane protein
VGLASRTVANSIYSLAGFAWPIVLAIVATPYVVRGLGTEGYGLFVLATATVGFLGVFDLGMGSALIKFVSDHFARREYDGINRAFATGLAFYLGVGLLGLAVALLGAPFFADEVLDVAPERRDTARDVFRVAGVTFFFTMVMTAFSAVPASIQRYDVQAKVNVAYTTATVGLVVLLVALDRSVVEVVAASAATTVLAIATYFLVDRRLLPLRPSLRVDRAMARRMFSFGGFALVSTVSGVAIFHIDKFVVGSIVGVGFVTFYAVPALLAIRIHAAVAHLSQVVFPLSSELLALGQTDRLHALYVRATRLVVAFVAAVSIPPMILSSEILRVWLGEEFVLRSSDVFVILIATYFVLALTAVPFYVAMGAGRPKINAFFSLCTVVLDVVLLLVLTPRFGIEGAAVAYLLSLAPVPLFIFFIERRILGVSSGLWVPLLARLLPAAALQCAVCFLLAGLVSGVASLLGVLALAFLAFPLAYVGLGFAPAEDRDLVRTLWAGRFARGTT